MLPTFVLAAVAAIMLMVLADSGAGPGARGRARRPNHCIYWCYDTSGDGRSYRRHRLTHVPPGKKAQGDKKIVQASIFAGNIFAAPRFLLKCAE